MFFMLLYCLFLSMTQLESKLSEKVDIVNNTKINDCKEDIMIMAVYRDTYLLTRGKFFPFQNNCQRGILYWHLVYSLVKQALVLKCYRFHFKLKTWDITILIKCIPCYLFYFYKSRTALEIMSAKQSTKVGTFHTILHPPYQAPARPRPTISGPDLPYQAPRILS